jgi:hypothetical protein
LGGFERLKLNLESYLDYLRKQAQKFLDDECFFIENDILKPTKRESFDRWDSV